MMESTKCPKCGKAMTQGYVVDRGYLEVKIPSWTEGAPNLSWWGGLKSPERERLLPVGAMRCTECGFLEFYARRELGPS